MKFRQIIYLVVFCLAAILTACEEAEEISGDSGLKIINNCDYSVKIYFDDTYIGRVSSEDDETWSVPSGQHTVKATCSFADDFEDSYNFISGNTLTVTLELTSKYGYEELSFSITE